MRGGQRRFGFFSENSSDLVAGPFLNIYHELKMISKYMTNIIYWEGEGKRVARFLPVSKKQNKTKYAIYINISEVYQKYVSDIMQF